MEVQDTPAGEDVSKRDGNPRNSVSDVQYYIQDQALVIEAATAKSDKNRAIERYFTAGARKHVEIVKDMNRTFARLGF
jgi:hypothetical protein